ncbi:MAG: hypothetical protein ACPG8W_26080, partial [Candidatus Promineifilaceae bacterium]
MTSARHGSRRIALQRLVNSAHGLNLDVMQGKLVKSAETGRWQIGPHDLLKWLESHEGQEILTVLASLEEGGVHDATSAFDLAPRTCRKCGRDYSDAECPHCRHNRHRI